MGAEDTLEKSERRFAEAVRKSGFVDEADLEWAVGLKIHAKGRGKDLALDRILLRFELLNREQADAIALALRYYTWRKEDKFYAKIAVQSDVLPEDSAKACLRDQKDLYKSEGRVRRLNAIAADRGLLNPKEDRAIIAAMRKVRPVTLAPADASPPEPPPAKPLQLSGSGVRAGAGRTLGDDDGPLDLVPLDDDDDDEVHAEERSPSAARRGEEREWRERARARDLAELSDVLGSAPPVKKRSTSDEDLDALWDEADLDDIELDSSARELARGAREAAADTASAPEDEDEPFLDDEPPPPTRRRR